MPQSLADATLAMVREYDLDLVKLTPSGLYAVEDWAGACIEYPGTDHDPPCLRTPAITHPQDWERLSVLQPTARALSRELEAVRLVTAGLGGETPCLMTVYSPLTLACKLTGKQVIRHLRDYPADLHAGLEIIAETTARFAQAALDAGAEGLFFATQLASHCWVTQSEYKEFGEHYDLAVLAVVAEQSNVTVLHLHGQDIFFELANRYPIHAVSWHDRETAPSLAKARQLTDRAFLTGLDRDLLGRGPVATIQAQVREALSQTKGRGLILAPSCVLPTTSPAWHLQAVRDIIVDR